MLSNAREAVGRVLGLGVVGDGTGEGAGLGVPVATGAPDAVTVAEASGVADPTDGPEHPANDTVSNAATLAAAALAVVAIRPR